MVWFAEPLDDILNLLANSRWIREWPEPNPPSNPPAAASKNEQDKRRSQHRDEPSLTPTVISHCCLPNISGD